MEERGSWTSKAKGHFTLRWRSPSVMNSRGILKFDWSRVTLLFGGGSHYNEESFGGELCRWMENDMVANMATLFGREVLQRSGFLGNLEALDMKLGLRRTPT